MADHDVPLVLFYSPRDTGHSQMALGFFNHFATGQARGWSEGSGPANGMNLAPVTAMSEIGIDVAGRYAQPWTEEIVEQAMAVITIDCADSCFFFPGTHYENWELSEPPDLTTASLRPVHDEIERRVRRLLTSLDSRDRRHGPPVVS